MNRALVVIWSGGMLWLACGMLALEAFGSSPDASPTLVASPAVTMPCPVTPPNGSTPPGERASPLHYGNGALWTVLWPNGDVLIESEAEAEADAANGPLAMKFPWWRRVTGELAIEGRRLDAPAPPLQADIPDGYGPTGFQASGIIFPSAGCWEITGTVAGASLTFVVRVVRVGEASTPPASA